MTLRKLKMLKVNFEIKNYLSSGILINFDANLGQELLQIYIN